MRRPLSLLLFFTLLFTVHCAVKGEVKKTLYNIEGKLIVEEKFLPKIILHGNGGQIFSYPRENGEFNLQDIPSGAYLLEVVSNQHLYPFVRIDVSARHNGKVRARLADDPNNQPLKYPLKLSPVGPIHFFDERQGFNFASLFKNQMVVMIGLMLVMMLIVPRLMDKDTMKDLQKNMNQSNPTDLVKKWVEGEENEKTEKGGDKEAEKTGSSSGRKGQERKGKGRKKKTQ